MSDKHSTLSWKRDETISVPSSSQERRIAIRYLDWERCKKKLAKTKNQVPRFHLVFSFLFGIAASSGFSLMAFYSNSQTKLPEWELPLYWLLFFFSLGVGSVFVYVDHQLRKKEQSDIEEIIDDMDAIEKTFSECQ